MLAVVSNSLLLGVCALLAPQAVSQNGDAPTGEKLGAPLPQLVEPQFVEHLDIQYSEVARSTRRNSLDLFVPKTREPAPLVMFVHGGSWTGGRKERHEHLAETLVRNGYACALINTRMFPFVRPDVMVQDCGHALGFLHRRAKDFGFDGNQLFVMGHSSGAHLAGWLALDAQKLKAAGVPKASLRGSILLSGVYDVRPRHLALDAVFGADRAFRQQATPLLFADAGDAPVFLAWGQHDLPGLSLCARMLRDRLLQARVPVAAFECADRNHADYVWSIGQQRDFLTAQMLQFLKQPLRAVTLRPKAKSCTVLWVATCDREHKVGTAMQAAMLPHGVNVQLQTIGDATGMAVAKAFRQLRMDCEAQRKTPPSHVAGIGAGGLAAALSPLTGVTDGLLGRIVAGTPLEAKSLSRQGVTINNQDFRFLKEAALLTLFGDQDAKSSRREAELHSIALMRAGREAHPVELPGTTAEAALLGMRKGDDLMVPMLLAFLFP